MKSSPARPSFFIRLLMYAKLLVRNYLIMTPLDRLYQIMCGRSSYPPWALKEAAGSRGYSYEVSGREMVITLKLLAGLKPEHRMLDIGCGTGKMALAMLHDGVLTLKGEYWGTDLQAKCIKWAQNNVSSKYPNCHFKHVTMEESEGYVFSFDDNYFDIIILHSVFTHMPPDIIEHYLREIKRIIKPNGRVCATFNLITEQNKEKYPLTSKGCSYKMSAMGDIGWAYEEDFVQEMIAKSGLKVVSPIHYGQRSSSPRGLLNQDLFILTKK